MNSFTILLSGDVIATPRLRRHIAPTRIIAADGGIRHAAMLDLEPYLWIGDFDSTPPDLMARYSTTPRIPYPVKKDKTDGELAIDAALAAGAREIILCGAFGGRTDQALMHMTMALLLAEKAITTLLTSGVEEGHPLLPGHHHFALPRGTLFSIIAFEAIHELHIKGAEWSGRWAQMDFGASLGLSNRVTGDDLEVSLSAGKGILIATLPQP